MMTQGDLQGIVDRTCPDFDIEVRFHRDDEHIARATVGKYLYAMVLERTQDDGPHEVWEAMARGIRLPEKPTAADVEFCAVQLTKAARPLPDGAMSVEYDG